VASDWKAYNEFAWTEDLLADPAGYEEVADHEIELQQSAESPQHRDTVGPGRAEGCIGSFTGCPESGSCWSTGPC
jgi:hypothetical protein